MYQIKDWEKHFETAKTKTFNRCQRLTFSNDLSDPHFRRLVRGHKDGYAHFGIWVAICEFHSSQSKPRLGYLTDDGQESGNPLSTSEIADLIRAPEKVVEVALQRLSDPYIGWIADERRPCDDHATTMVGDQSSPLSTPLHSTLKSSSGDKTIKKTIQSNAQIEFEQFWDIWPKKVDKDKCRQWWKRNKPDQALFDLMVTNIEAMKKTPQWEDRQYIPGPYKWLYGRRWGDEIPKPKKSVMEMLKGIKSEPRPTD